MEIREIRHRDEQYANYRIPGMLMTRSGVLLVFFEARRASGDWSMMDIQMQRSSDGGRSFLPPVILAQGSETHPTVNNPVMAEDAQGRLHFLYCEDYTINGGRILHRVSTDDGATWSVPEDVTASADPEFHNALALGPGHGICTPDGTLLFPVWMVPKSAGAELTAHGPSVVSVLYSRDDGSSWQLGELLPVCEGMNDPGETELTLTEDGTVLLNCRLGWGAFCRGQAYSRTGYDGWQDVRLVRELTDPCCFGSVVSGRCPDGVFRLFYCGCRSTEDRVNVTVRVSEDGGRTWNAGRTVDALRGGYVESALSPDGGTLYVLYEDRYGEADYLAVMNVIDLV